MAVFPTAARYQYEPLVGREYSPKYWPDLTVRATKYSMGLLVGFPCDWNILKLIYVSHSMCFSQRSLRKSRNRLSLICPATSYNWMWISSHIYILYQLYSYTFKLLIVDTQRHSRCLAVLGRSRLVLQLLGLEGTRLQSFEGMFSALWSLLHASDLVPGATVEEILQLIGVLYHYLQGFNHSMGRPLAGTMLF